ncbi:MAG: M1 family metallopeptidase [Chitinophagaceae bacterium]
MFRNLFLIVLTLLSITVFGQVSGGKLKPEQANMDIRHYNIHLEVIPESKELKGFTEIDLILQQAASSMIIDLDSRYKVSNVSVDGKKANFQHLEGLITTIGNYGAGKHQLKIEYAGNPPVAKRAPWDGGIQWSVDSLNRPWIALTCQEDGAKIFFPCKDHPSDEPNEGADMVITVPKGLVVAGPGLLVKVSHSGKKSTYHWKTNYTINNYCLVFNVGHYVVVSRKYKSSAGNSIPMEYYVLDYNKPRAEKHLDLFERSAHMLEKYFGEYPWAKEKMAMAETPHLGMEHQTMNAYGNQYRYTKMGEVDFDWLMHHEFGHEWWANKVSNNDWGHMWIQEGICSFGDALFTEEYGGRRAYIDLMKRNAIVARNTLPIVQGDTVDSRQAYHPDIYGKGAYFMHTLRFVLGDDVFFPALKSFIMNPNYTYDHMVDTKDVLLHFNAASNRDLKPLFDLYLYTTNKLEVLVKEKNPGVYSISLGNMNMDLPIEVIGSEGKQKLILSSKPVEFKSNAVPQIDPDGYYMKRVTID